MRWFVPVAAATAFTLATVFARAEAKAKPKAQAKAPDPTPSASASAPAKPAPPAPEIEPEDKRALLLTVEVGVAHVDLGGLRDSLGFDKTAANGGLFGAGVGVRLDKLRVGARFRIDDTTEYTLWSMLAEVGYGLAARPFQPAFFLHGGWLWSAGMERAVIASSLPPLNVLPPDTRVRGPVVGAEAQGLLFLAKQAAIGPFIGFDVMFLHRPQLGLPQSLVQLPPDIKQNPLYTDSGSGVGWSVELGLRGALDLGI